MLLDPNDKPVAAKQEKPVFNEYQDVIVPDCMAEISKLTISGKDIKLELSLKDFPTSMNKPGIYGESNGKGSVFGILAWLKKNDLSLNVAMCSLPPTPADDESTQ